MTLLGIYQASCGQMLMKIGGNQAGAFPDLPIQPRHLDFSRKTQFTALEIFNFCRRCFFIREFVYSPYSCNRSYSKTRPDFIRGLIPVVVVVLQLPNFFQDLTRSSPGLHQALKSLKQLN